MATTFRSPLGLDIDALEGQPTRASGFGEPDRSGVRVAYAKRISDSGH